MLGAIPSTWGPAEDDWYLDYQEQRDIPVREAQNVRMRNLFAPVRDFSQKFLNGTPTIDDADSVFQQLIELRRAIDAADTDGVHESMKDDAIGYLAGACECLARNDGLFQDTHKLAFIREQLLLASTNRVPESDDERNKQFDSAPGWGVPSARIESAQGLPLLCRQQHAVNDDVIAAIKQLSRDGANSVRFMIAERLRFLFPYYPTVFWEIAERFAVAENSHPVLMELINSGLYYLPREETEHVANLAWHIFDRVGRAEGARDAGRSCLSLFLKRYIRYNDPRFRKFLYVAIDNPLEYASHLSVIPGVLREVLGLGISGPITLNEAEMRQRLGSIAESDRSYGQGMEAD